MLLYIKYIIRFLTGWLISFLRVGKYFTKNKLTVFCFHDVSSKPSEFSAKYNLNVSPEVFEYQIKFIINNFNVISPDDLLANEMPEHSALITFDDGFKSYFSTAIPILNKYKLPSLIFLNMAPIKGDIFMAGLTTYLCEKSYDFRQFVKSKARHTTDNKSLFLYCSREIIASYLKNKGVTYKNEVEEYVGEFATLQDLESSSSNPLVFYGNHLYNHDVALLLKDKELLESYSTNEDELNNYPNHRRLFAFPFGQPDTCFSESQIRLLLEHGAKKVFSSYPLVNTNTSAKYMHRIPLSIINNTNANIWINILGKSLKKYGGICAKTDHSFRK
jgi:hypothetical protein